MVKLRLFGLELEIYDRLHLALIILPITLCILFYIAPIPDKTKLQFSFENPNPLLIYIPPLIHINQTHLVGNMISYLVLIHANIILFALTKENQRLIRYAAATFIALPIVYALLWNIFTYTFYNTYFGSVGFSSMVAAFAAIQISYSTLAYMKATTIEYNQSNLFLATLILVAGIILGAYYKPEPLYIVAGVCMAMLFLYYVREPLSSICRYYVRLRSPEFIVVTEVLLLGVLFVILGFPGNFVVGDGVINILGHWVGLLWGLLLPQIDHHLTGGLPQVQS